MLALIMLVIFCIVTMTLFAIVANSNIRKEAGLPPRSIFQSDRSYYS